jgi:hypothetical protein
VAVSLGVHPWRQSNNIRTNPIPRTTMRGTGRIGHGAVYWPDGPRWSVGSYYGGEFAPRTSARSSRDLGQKSTAELQRSLRILAASSLGCTEAILLARRDFAPLGAGRSRSDPFSVNESNRVADHACICCRRVDHRALFDVSRSSRATPCHRPEPVPRAASIRHYREHGHGQTMLSFRQECGLSATKLAEKRAIFEGTSLQRFAVRKSGHGRRSNRRALRRPPLT